MANKIINYLLHFEIKKLMHASITMNNSKWKLRNKPIHNIIKKNKTFRNWFTKEVKDLYNEHYTILLKEIRET